MTNQDDRTPLHTGGCQCGAVRYAIFCEPTNPHVCHCRMCQKQFGSYFAPLASVPLAHFAWTRGTPGVFRSSDAAERGFCASCGTPLFFRYVDKERIAIALGSLDEPQRVTPAKAYGLEGRMPWLDIVPGLPGETTEQATPADMMARLGSRQHPDHDTETWPPAR
ncbi:GFA family protein [Alsobacter sp. R-9]